MKRRILSALSVVFLFVCFSVPVCAASVKQNNIEIDIPREFKVINKENVSEYKDYIESIGFSKSSFKNYLDSNSILIYACDMKGSEIVVSSFSFDFSAEISDLYYMNEEDIRQVFSNVLGNREYEIIDKGENRFLKYDYSSSDKGGSFSGVQLLTVKNSKVYSIIYTVPSNASVNEKTIDALAAGAVFKGDSSLPAKKVDNIATFIILSLAIIVFLITAGYIIFTFVLDIKKRKNQSDVAPYVVIKRRKF